MEWVWNSLRDRCMNYRTVWSANRPKNQKYRVINQKHYQKHHQNSLK